MATASIRKRVKVQDPLPTPARTDWQGRAAQIVLIVVTLAALWPVCANDFTSWDDNLNVSKNPSLNPVSVGSLLHFWTGPYGEEYIPLSYTVWGGLAAIARVGNADAAGITLNPYVFHTVNLLLHLAAVLLASQILRLLSGRVWAAAAGALLFAIHPIQVEPIAWVTGLKDVLCGMLSLAAIWQYILFARPTDASRSTPPDRMRAIHYALATLAFILAMLAKSTAVTVPLAAIIIDWLLLRRSWKQIAIALGPWLALAFPCAVVARAVHPVLETTDGGPLWARPLLAGAALAFYLIKVVWPIHFAAIYHYSVLDLLAGNWLRFAWIVPAALLIAAFVLRKRWPWLLAGAGLIVVATLPVLGLTPFHFEAHSLVADRYFYVAMLGPALILTYALASAPPRPIILSSVCAAGLIGLAIRSNLQTAVWHDTVTLFTHELDVNPTSFIACNSLASTAVERHDYAATEKWARESIRLQAEQTDAYDTLGIALMAQGRGQETAALWLDAYKHNPDNPAVLTNLAGLVAQQSNGDPRKLDEAERLCRRAIQIDPRLASAHENLAIMLFQQGQFDEALREAQRSVGLNPTNPHSQITLAVFLDHDHQHDAAIDHVRQAIQLNPDDARARQLLANLTHSPG